MGSLARFTPEELLAIGIDGRVEWDRTRARNQGRALRDALADERREAGGHFRASLRRDEAASLWGLLQWMGPGARHVMRTPWRVGHHAGRLFALREALYDVDQTYQPNRAT